MKILPWLCAALLLPACAPPTTIESAGTDQEVIRDATLALRTDPRFSEVTVKWAGRNLLLLGRVDDANAEREALEIAASRARPATVISRLEIRPR